MSCATTSKGTLIFWSIICCNVQNKKRKIHYNAIIYLYEVLSDQYTMILSRIEAVVELETFYDEIRDDAITGY